MKGLEVKGEISDQVTNQAQSCKREGYELKLDIPQGALSADLE